jgi:hypothetical protein
MNGYEDEYMVTSMRNHSGMSIGTRCQQRALYFQAALACICGKRCCLRQFHRKVSLSTSLRCWHGAQLKHKINWKPGAWDECAVVRQSGSESSRRPSWRCMVCGSMYHYNTSVKTPANPSTLHKHTDKSSNVLYQVQIQIREQH